MSAVDIASVYVLERTCVVSRWFGGSDPKTGPSMASPCSQPQLRKVAVVRERQLAVQLQQPQRVQLRVALGVLPPASRMQPGPDSATTRIICGTRVHKSVLSASRHGQYPQ